MAKNPGAKLAPEVKNKIIARYKKGGISIRQLAKDNDSSYTTVHNILEAAGIKMERRGHLTRPVAGSDPS